VIVDLALGDSDGLDLVKEMKRRHPQIPALVLSMHDEMVDSATELAHRATQCVETGRPR
jgi:DNA-binding NarL/FixJ family response regulator